MLQIRNICKEYHTGSLVQKALDKVSLNLRDNEFVAILGPSGSGKTTLLNIIGGLDRYDSGDLIINGISTKKYKERDWDSYRNHTIGFVFQSYNLIPHQTLLSNVELALTISGVGKAQRREKARRALEQVGLGEQMHKKPNQLSGGQMQRVAIARALVNDPDILLADEPTGALDSETSVQVMQLLKNVARDRLVVMVTHNPELAFEYATRIVNLKDGCIVSDSNPYDVDENMLEEPEHKNMGKASMSFLTALSLSFNNLKTKKARTLLTSFAGSIGIIGIALILSLSTGVNQYIKQIEKETLSEYPLQIQSTGIDLSSLMVGMSGTGGDGAVSEENAQNGDIHVIQMVTNMFSTMDSNDLESLKKYLESGESSIENYTNAIEYSYNVVPQIYRQDGSEIRQVHPDQSFDALGLGSSTSTNSMMSSMMSTDVFYEMPENEELYEGQYDVMAGRWPEDYNECVLVLTAGGGMSDFLLYTMGLRDPMELDEMIDQFIAEEKVATPSELGNYTYDEILGTEFRLVNSADYYAYDSQYKVWKDKAGDEEYMKNLVANGESLTIVGVVEPAEDASASSLMPGIGYPASLVKHVAEEAARKEIVKQQLSDPSINVFTGETFGEESGDNGFDMNSLISVDEEKLKHAFGFDTGAFSNLEQGIWTSGTDSSLDLSSVMESAASSMDLSGMVDLSSVKVDLPDMPSVSLKELIGSLDISVTPGGMENLAKSLLEGYRQYAQEHPEADYSGLQQDFVEYLQTEDAKVILKDNIGEIIGTGEGITVTTEQLKSMLGEIMEGYQKYVNENGLTDPDKFDEYLAGYLQTSEAHAILDKWANEIFSGITGNVSITGEQIEKLASELAQGYQTYANVNGLPDPSRMGEHFINYLGTEDGQRRLTEGVSEMVDISALEEQVTGAVNAYMQDAMSAYGEAIGSVLKSQIASAMQQVTEQMAAGMQQAMGQAMSRIGAGLQEAMSGGMNIDADAFAQAFQINMTGQELAELMMTMGNTASASYENNLTNLGYVDFDVPSGIDLYPKDFESKEEVVRILDEYNSRMEEEGKDEQVITYTDLVGTLMSSVTDIIDIISYVLIAFVAISLIVSSIMIGVITYISVLERKKEIGILRAIGASRGNISQVFNAETFIIGLCAGLIGIGLTLLILIPGNMIIHSVAGTNDVSAMLPVIPAIVLIMLSVVLTLLGGLIPSRKAAKSDPVTALRTE